VNRINPFVKGSTRRGDRHGIRLRRAFVPRGRGAFALRNGGGAGTEAASTGAGGLPQSVPRAFAHRRKLQAIDEAGKPGTWRELARRRAIPAGKAQGLTGNGTAEGDAGTLDAVHGELHLGVFHLAEFAGHRLAGRGLRHRKARRRGATRDIDEKRRGIDGLDAGAIDGDLHEGLVDMRRSAELKPVLTAIADGRTERIVALARFGELGRIEREEPSRASDRHEGERLARRGRRLAGHDLRLFRHRRPAARRKKEERRRAA
jgi:hypothetical protein